MNKKLGVILVIIVLIILGGVAFVMSNKSSKSTAVQTAAPITNPTETTAPTTGTVGALKSLMTSNIPQTCTFTSQKQATTNGTIYVSGGKLRGDFTSTNEGQTITGHMIVDTGFSYIWTDMTKRGMKVAITEGQTSGNTNNQSMDLNQPVSYTCKPWIPDASKFTLPTDISFMTFTMPKTAIPSGSATTGASSSGTGTAPSACSACDSLPAAAQSVCKTQLHCQ